jgi:UDP-3-O-[3-hydroxymyristoyl] glucosamine N-acyltransferase
MSLEISLADVQRDSLKPLTQTRSVSDIEAGGESLQERTERILGVEGSNLLVPEHLEDVTVKNGDLYGTERTVNETSGAVVMNPAAVPRKGLREELEELEAGEKLVYENVTVAFRPEQEISNLSEAERHAEDCREIETDKVMCKLEYMWDIVEHTPELIEEFFPGGETRGEIHEDAVVHGDKEKLYLGEGAEVDANAHIDVSDGPVYIGEETRIYPGSRITGPTYIGRETKVGAGQSAVVHEGTHIGDVCRAERDRGSDRPLIHKQVPLRLLGTRSCGFMG